MNRITTIVVAILALLVSGCAQAAQTAVEQTTGVKVDQKGDTVTVKGKDGESLTFSSDLPAEFKDFPVPSSFKVDSSGSISMGGGGDKLSVVAYKGKATTKDVGEFYRKTAKEKGWEEEFSFEDGKGGQLHYSTKGDIGYIVTYTDSGNDTEISVMISKTTPQPMATATRATAIPERESTPTPSRPGPTPTPATPATGDTSSIPAELKEIPTPQGFAVVKDSTHRVVVGGKAASAGAILFGKTAVDEVAKFYQNSLPAKGWNEVFVMEDVSSTALLFENAQTEGTSLAINVQKTEAGTEVTMMYAAGN
jgi:hypothetical protein